MNVLKEWIEERTCTTALQREPERMDDREERNERQEGEKVVKRREKISARGGVRWNKTTRD
jgi:hypothetical protein